MARYGLIIVVHLRKIEIMTAEKGRKAVQIKERSEIQKPDGEELESFFQSTMASLLPTVNSGRCRTAILYLSSELISFRYFFLPFKSPRKAGQVLAFELENKLAFSPAPFVFDFYHIFENEGEHLFFVGAIKKSLHDAFVKSLLANRIKPLTITPAGLPEAVAAHAALTSNPDMLFIRVKAESVAVILICNCKPCLVRSFTNEPKKVKELAVSIKQSVTAFSQKSGVMPEVTIVISRKKDGNLLPEMDQLLREAFSINGKYPPLMAVPFAESSHPIIQPGKMSMPLFNFGKPADVAFPFLKAHSKQLMLAFSFGFLICFMVFGELLLDIRRLETQISIANQQMVHRYSRIFPRAKQIRDPYRELKATVLFREKKEKESNSKTPKNADVRVIDLLAAVSRKIPPILDLTLTRFVLNDRRLILHGSTDKFNTVDKIKNSLEQDPSFKRIDIGSASLDKQDKRIKCKFIIELQNNGAIGKR